MLCQAQSVAYLVDQILSFNYYIHCIHNLLYYKDLALWLRNCFITSKFTFLRLLQGLLRMSQ